MVGRAVARSPHSVIGLTLLINLCAIMKLKNYTLLTTIFLFVVFCGSAQAQQGFRTTVGTSMGIVGQGDRLIPSVHIGYAHPVASVLDVEGQIRFSRLSTLDHEDLLRRDRLTYLDASLGIGVHPVELGRHRLSFEAGVTSRGRWEYDAYRVRIRRRGGEIIEQEIFFDRRRSADVGARIKVMYSTRITTALRLGLYMEGYNYNDGTGIFFFGLQSSFSL
ncbi:hypothetical protein CRI93_01085 [Longimonas halophila]|uniref:Uncharacterized protein n=2 Tax=Longimonas halophila TaxID=1469170 RepID=A0A2H3NQJ4_9BACT|nr:hypothetical protein CRI93_01085 [Longimonas halophila]